MSKFVKHILKRFFLSFLFFQIFFSNCVLAQCTSCSPGGAINYSTNTTISSSACYTSGSMDNNTLITVVSGATLTICGNWVGQNGDGITVNSGGALIITGSLTLSNAFSLIANGSVSIGSININNNSSMSVEGTGSLFVTNNVTIGNGAAVTIASGGILDVGGNLSVGSGTISVSGTLDVTGTLTGVQPSGSAVQYRSAATGNWGTNGTWQYSTNGTSWYVATGTPTSANGSITILNGHNVSLAASVTADELTVDSGGTLTINSGQTLTIANGSAATDCQVNGTLSNVGVVTTTGALTFGSTGVYIHAQVGGTVPQATWASTSTCKITGATTSLPSGITNSGSNAQTNLFGNFIWDCPNQTSEINFAAGGSSWTLFTLEGSFTVNNTGTSNLIFSGDATNVNRTFIVKGNFEIAKTGTATVFYLNEYWDNITLNVYGEILISGGQFYSSKIQGEEQIINVEKGIVVSGTGVFISQNQTATPSLYTTINFTNTQSGGFSSNLSLSTGLTRYGQAAWNINIKNGRTITLTSNIELGKDRTFTVESGGTLILPTTYVIKNNTSGTLGDGTTFNLNSGGILKIQNVDGIVTSGATGGIQTNTRTFNAGGHYHFTASAAQVTGNALPATISGSLVINNTQAINSSNTGVSLSQATTISGILTLTAGVLTTTTNLLSISNTSSAALSGGSSTAFVNGPLKWTVANSGGGNYKFQIGKSGVYLPLNVGSPAGTAPAITAQAFVTSSGGSASTGLSSISTSEYWSIINTGTLTSSTISLAKSDISSNDAIASSTTLAAAYTNNLATCITTSTLINSNSITAGATSGSFATITYFVMAATLRSTITLTANTVVAANSCASSTKVPIQSFILTPSAGNGNLTNVGFTTTGTYVQADITKYQLWYGTSSSIGSAAQLGADLTSSGIAGARTFAAFTTPTLTSGTPYYFWITADVTSGATNNATIAVDAVTTSNLTSTSTKAGTTSAGGTQTLKARPTSAVLAGTTSICNGSSANLTVTVTGGTSPYSVVYSGGTVSSYTSASNISVSPTTNTTYTLTSVTDANGCLATTPSGSPLITVNTLPTVSSTVVETSVTANDGTVCSGSSVTLSGTGAISYSWNNSVTNATTFTPITTTTYTVTGTDANSCTNTATRTITVNTLPIVSSTVVETSVTANDGTVCSGSSVTLSGTGAISYSWNNSVTNATAFTPSTTTTYTVTGTGANSCTNTANRTITVNTLPTVSSTVAETSVTANDGTVCSGSSVTLSGTGASSYSWNNSVTNATSFTPTTTTTYTVTGTDANSCTNTATRTITVNTLPTVGMASSSVCIGNTVALSPSTLGTWTSSNSSHASVISVTGVVTAVSVGSSSFTYTLTSTGCSATTAALTVNSPQVSSAAHLTQGYLIWHGDESDDWSDPANWLVHNIGGSHTVASAAPTATSTIVVSAAGTCIVNHPTIASSTVYAKDIVIESGATLTMGTGGVLHVAGNFTNNGAFIAGSGSVTFNGSVAQTITGNAPTFNNLTINNSSGGVTSSVATSVLGTLTLTSGKLNVQGVTLTIGSSTTDGTISGGSSTSYIVAYDAGSAIGYVKHFVNANNVLHSYPIGDLTSYVPLTFTLTANSGLSGAYFSVYTKNVKIPSLNSSFSSYLQRFWEGVPNGMTSPTYTISYVYADGDISGSETNLKPIKKSGVNWYKPSGATFTTGQTEGTSTLNTTTNTLTWSGLTTFSSYTAAGDQVVSLPIETVHFKGQKTTIGNKLEWKTVSENQSDYFTIEKTTDGQTFEIVGKVDATGGTNKELDYELIDLNFINGINYYRLVRTNYDGLILKTDLISIDNRKEETVKVVDYETNILGQEINEFYRGLVIIVYTDGSSIKVIR